VLKALSKEPKDRFSRIADFAAALSATIGPIPPSPAKPPQKISDPLEVLFQEGVKAQARGDVETAYHIWEQIAPTPDGPFVVPKMSPHPPLKRLPTPDGPNNTFVVSAKNRLAELRPAFIALCVKQANDAHMNGLWQKEIELWEKLLTLPDIGDGNYYIDNPITLYGQNRLSKPDISAGYYYNQWQPPKQSSIEISKPDIEERIKVAKQNMQIAWMYENAMQFVKKSDLPSAKTQLEMLWHDAPYYGDPKGLARIIGIQPVPNYEQALKNQKQQREAQEWQQREAQEWQREQAQKAQERQQKQQKLYQQRAILIPSIVFVLTCAFYIGFGVYVIHDGIVVSIIFGIISGLILASVTAGFMTRSIGPK